MKCIICGNDVPKHNKDTCSPSCWYKKRYRLNKSKIDAWHKRYQETHKEQVRQYKNKWAREHNAEQRERYKYRKIEVYWTREHRIEILKIVGDKCRICGEPYEEMHHTSYKDLPHANLKEYCKFLIPLCRKHHKKIHQDK